MLQRNTIALMSARRHKINGKASTIFFQESLQTSTSYFKQKMMSYITSANMIVTLNPFNGLGIAAVRLTPVYGFPWYPGGHVQV